MNQTKLLFPLIFISLEDDSSIVIPPQPTSPGEIMSGGEGEPVEADEPEEGENDTTPAETERTISGVLASTETVTHEYLTQSGKVVRETISQIVGGTVLSTKTLDFFYDESGRPFAFNYSVDGGIASTYYYILNLQGDVVQIIDVIKKDGRKAAYTSQRNSRTDFPVIACCVSNLGNKWFVSVGARPAKAKTVIITEDDFDTLKEMAKQAADAFTYGDNVRASGAYRKTLATVYIRRLMEQIKGRSVGRV